MEILVTIGVIGVTWFVVIAVFQNGFLSLAHSRSRVVALEIANDQLEIIRNMPYDSIGTTSGWPTGDLPSTQTVSRSDQSFTVTIRVDYIDDPFDGNLTGTIPGKPVDTAPNDYKRADVTVVWEKASSVPVKLSTLAVPRGVEAATNTGSFIFTVFDASGVGVPQATVRVTNDDLVPAIDITNTTDNYGNLQIIGLPPSAGGYEVVVSKTGYSTEQTYDPAVVSNPVRPSLSVIANAVTQASFSIDRVSTLAIATQGENCTPIGNVPLSLWGQKLIATDPDIKKYTSNPPTDASGQLTLSTLEWDSYTLIETSGAYDVAGVIPPIFLDILPNTSQSINLVLAPATAHSALVTVKNATDGTTVTGASVRLTTTGYDETKLTGVGYFSQTDWSGGAGQADFTDQTKYESDDGNLDVASTSGSVSLRSSASTPVSTESFETDNLKDTAATTADWNTGAGALRLLQTAGLYEAGGIGQSTKLNTSSGLVTKATLNATVQDNGQSILYELSANGGVNFEAVTPGVEHTFTTAGTDLRFRITLATADPNVSPIVEEISVTPTVTTYAAAGVLTSSTLDTNDPAVDFRQLLWTPTAQSANVGAESVRFQVAANTDHATWNFVGPDGTAGSFFTTSGQDVPAALDGQRYVRIRMYLQTADVSATPVVSFTALGYTSGCVPPGQAFFPNLTATNYDMTITTPGFEEYTTSLAVNGATKTDVELTPLP